MSDPPGATAGERAWAAALSAAALFAVSSKGSGIALRARPGPVRDRFLAALCAMLPPGTPVRRIPLHIGDDRLLGGLDLPATLQAGRPIASSGLLADANGGIVLLAMAERVSAATAARLCHTLESGEVIAERDGMALRRDAAIGLVALDEGAGDDERSPAALLDHLAFLIDLTAVSLGEASAPRAKLGLLGDARAKLASVTIPDDGLHALCSAAAAMGVTSLHALLSAVRAARAAAALAGRHEPGQEDIILAAQLVLAPRATILPDDAAQPPPAPPDAAQDSAPGRDAEAGSGAEADPAESPGEARDQALNDIVLAAAKAAMPADVLAALLARKAERAGQQNTGGAGAASTSQRRGRPVGVRAGALRNGARLNLVETLRAAAPWQTLRRRAQPNEAAFRIIVVPDDFRITRFRHRTKTTTIFAVDASGSAALNRLGEAKGAVELVLADCYVRRDRVALIAFRGTSAEVLLPPTSSLVRAKRSLAGLPGGGGTPLAAGIDAAGLLAGQVRRQGQTAVVILLSDGRANVARDGKPGRAGAETDALAAARLLRAGQVPAVLVDTSPRAAPEARRLAAEMGALYLPLPYADSGAVSRAALAVQHG